MTADEKKKLREAIKLVGRYCRKEASVCFKKYDTQWHSSQTQQADWDSMLVGEWYDEVADELTKVSRRLPK